MPGLVTRKRANALSLHDLEHPPRRPRANPLTADTVMRYHLCWKHRDLDG
jgi:hypothetical protein